LGNIFLFLLLFFYFLLLIQDASTHLKHFNPSETGAMHNYCKWSWTHLLHGMLMMSLWWCWLPTEFKGTACANPIDCAGELAGNNISFTSLESTSLPFLSSLHKTASRLIINLVWVVD
jgi:hypothetical protein